MHAQEALSSLLAAHVSGRLATGDPPPPLRDPASPAETFLAGFPSLNPFSAAVLLAAAKSLRRLVTLQPAERAALARAVPDMPSGSLELFYRQLEYGRRLVPASRGMPEVRGCVSLMLLLSRHLMAGVKARHQAPVLLPGHLHRAIRAAMRSHAAASVSDAMPRGRTHVLTVILFATQDAQHRHGNVAGDCWTDTDAPALRPQHELVASAAARTGGQTYLAADLAAAEMVATAPRMQLRAAGHGVAAEPGPRQQAEAGQRSAASMEPPAPQAPAAPDVWQRSSGPGPQAGADIHSNGDELSPGAADAQRAFRDPSGRLGWQYHSGTGTAQLNAQRWPAAEHAVGGAQLEWGQPYSPGGGRPSGGDQGGCDPHGQGQDWQHAGVACQPQDDMYGGGYMSSAHPRLAHRHPPQETRTPDAAWLEDATRGAPWELPASDPALQRGIARAGLRGMRPGARVLDDDALHPVGMSPPYGLQPHGLAASRRGFSHAGYALPDAGRSGNASTGWPRNDGLQPNSGRHCGWEPDVLVGTDLGMGNHYGSFCDLYADAGWPAGRGPAPAHRRGHGDAAYDAGMQQDGVDEFGVRDAAELFALGTQAQEPPPDVRWGQQGDVLWLSVSAQVGFGSGCRQWPVPLRGLRQYTEVVPLPTRKILYVWFLCAGSGTARTAQAASTRRTS